MTAPDPWQATLHLEVRSRAKRPGQSSLEQRVYTATLSANPTQPDDATLHMVRTSEGFGTISQSVTTWRPTEHDPQARTATFRESLRRSDRLVGELEEYGWVRRRDLEGAS